MSNSLIFSLHSMIVGSLVLIALRFGKEALFAFLALLTVAMNLFVIKQIDLFGLHVTASDATAVGYLLGLNLIQEVYGKKAAKKCVALSFLIALSFCLLSLIHLSYRPNTFDKTQSSFRLLLLPSYRIYAASLFSFLVIQFFDLRFFSLLRKKTQGRYLPLRIATALLLSELLDTVLFTYLGLWGIVHAPFEIVCVSLVVKCAAILLLTPFSYFAKKICHYETIPV